MGFFLPGENMRFNTGNPVEPNGSSAPQDLYDNGGIADLFVNGAALSVLDRLQRPRKSLAGMESAFADLLLASGFETLHLKYVAGTPLGVARQTQLIDYNGSVYRVKLPSAFPLQLTGVWASDEPKLVDVGDVAIRQALGNLSDPTQGAGMIGRGIQAVVSFAQLRTLPKTSLAKVAVFQGDMYYLDAADTTSVDNGGTVAVNPVDGARWKIPYKGIVRPRMFRGVGDGTGTDWAALTAATAVIRANGGGVLDLEGSNITYTPDRPWKLYSNMNIVGKAYIIPKAGFSSDVVFPTYGTEAPQRYNTLAYFNDGTHADDPTNFGYRGLTIDDGVEFYGNYLCENGLILEGITNFRVSARFQQFNSVGLYPKYYCWGGRINAHISSCRARLLKLGEAANGIDLNGLQAYGDADDPDYLVEIVGDNNGINLAGAFIEKGKNGILWSGPTGPSSISGVDFEDCIGVLLTVDGTGLTDRAAGPITVTGSFLEAGSRIVKAINAVVIVQGCRVRDTPVAFEAVGPRSRVYDIANEMTGVAARSIGFVISDIVVSAGRKQINHLPNFLTSSVESYGIENNSYSYNQEVMVNGLSFSSQVIDDASKRMLSSSTWETRELRAGAVYGVMGLRLDYLSGSKSVVPRSDNDHTLGTAALRFGTIFTGSAVSTSDARHKTEVRGLTDAEIAAAKDLGKEIGAYRWIAAVDEKGEKAREHIGMTVQRAIEVLASHGLDAMSYGFICFDKWDDGDLYSFRMDGLLAFIAAGFEARLAKLEM
jgi:hypothetical protein